MSLVLVAMYAYAVRRKDKGLVGGETLLAEYGACFFLLLLLLLILVVGI